jgi:hypothetical protein
MSLGQKADYLKGLYKQYAPTVQEIQKLSQGFKQPEVPADEIEQRIKELEAADPMFQSIAAQLRDLVKLKAQFTENLRNFVAHADDLTNALTSFEMISSRVSDYGTNQAMVDDPILKNIFQQIAEDQEYRVLYLYDEVVRSHNYLTLGNYRPTINLVSLRNKMNELMERQQTVDEAVTMLTKFFDVQISIVANSLRDLVDKVDSRIVLREGKRDFKLSAAQMKKLTETGTVSLSFTKDFFQNVQNVRIRNIELVGGSYKIGKVFDEKKNASDWPGITLRYSLGETGSFNTPGVIEYRYPANGEMFSWESTFELKEQVWESTENKVSGDFKGLLTGLVDGNEVVKNSAIFSAHAGITDLKISVANRQGPYFPTTMGLRIHYIYSSR